MSQPGAEEPARPAPAPQPLFIFGFHRSGTTLLQRLLNTYGDVLIWGEHVGFLRDVANAYYRIWRNPDYFASTQPLQTILADTRSLTHWQAWMNWTDEHEWRRLYREFLQSVFVPRGLPGKRFWGWKEVHYTAANDDRTVPFLAELYPDALFVFVVRNGFNNLASFSAQPLRRNIVAWSVEGCARWKANLRYFREWHETGRLRSFWIRFEDLVQGDGEVHRLLQVMGKELGEEQRAVLQAGTARGSSFNDSAVDDRWRALPSVRLGIAHAAIGTFNRELGYAIPPVPVHSRFAGRLLYPAFTFAYLVSRLWLRVRHSLVRSLPAAKRTGRQA